MKQRLCRCDPAGPLPHLTIFGHSGYQGQCFRVSLGTVTLR